MKLILLTLLSLLFLHVGTAFSHYCDGKVPYYAGQGYGPGRVIPSIFLFPASTAITVMTVPVYRRTGNGSSTGGAACMALYHAGMIKAFSSRRTRLSEYD